MFSPRLFLALMVCVCMGCATPCDCPVDPVARLLVTHQAMIAPSWNISLDRSCVQQEQGRRILKCHYVSQEILSLADARQMLYDVVESLVTTVAYHPFLQDWNPQQPFDVQDLDLVITYESFYGRFVDPKYTCQIRMEQGCVTYYAYTAFEPKALLFQRHREPYALTRTIVEAQKDVGVYPLKVTREMERQAKIKALEESLEQVLEDS